VRASVVPPRDHAAALILARGSTPRVCQAFAAPPIASLIAAGRARNPRDCVAASARARSR
jgi:hypothetical protein